MTIDRLLALNASGMRRAGIEAEGFFAARADCGISSGRRAAVFPGTRTMAVPTCVSATSKSRQPGRSRRRGPCRRRIYASQGNEPRYLALGDAELSCSLIRNGSQSAGLTAVAGSRDVSLSLDHETRMPGNPPFGVFQVHANVP